MQEIEQKQDLIQCSQHFYKKATFLKLDLKKIDAQAVCQYCALSRYNENVRVLFIEEINSDDPYNMIANWPPVTNQNLIDQFAQICDEIYINYFESQTNLQQITEYFSKIKENLIQKIQQIEKKFLQIASEINIQDLMKVYNELIERDKLKEVIKKYSASQTEELKKIIQNAKEKTDVNSRVIEQLINQYEQQKKKIDLNQFDLFFEGIHNTLDNFFISQGKKLDTYKSFTDFIVSSRFNQKIQLLDGEFQQYITDLNSNYESYLQELPKNLEKGQKQKLIQQQMQIIESLTKILKQHIDTIKMPLNEKIKLKLKQKQVLSNQQDFKIEGYKVNQMNGYNFAFIDVPITQEHVGDSFTIKINNLQNWIGIGIVDKNQLLQKIYKFTGLFSDKFCYTISQNGYAWSLLSENQNKKKISFFFKTNDIIKITIQYEHILFENLTINDSFLMDFQFEEGKQFCPGFCLFNQHDQIEFI
ncbi:hypothetical protein TTHERM_00506930 (macronuclear) [Tetrahymena thermophila SB210]|uniref:Zinc carboxypeptidase family protein n=1 Tax=Tetrahymena thermophila (strain SB210) TaxID=312017 RepID=I7ME51_TETTS|nr:hypothetical protein TTHERM_00506930 [Tetrahymena thermophila SB210]EAR94950.1 hypothetical protein TTHERM_00506930 [Tetrahymena thermophila SB210]|eukprot:XP_001015195.1 hypothetical protein TTHERM_00506930 [Tetrahymena thermophila SB210]